MDQAKIEKLEQLAATTAYKIVYLLRQTFANESEEIKEGALNIVMRRVNEMMSGPAPVIVDGPGLTRVVEEPVHTEDKYKGDPQE